MLNPQTLNLMSRAIRAHDRVERTLRGARPRDLNKRFRHLLRPAEVVKERVDHPDGTIAYVPTTLSHLGLAGHLRVAAWAALGESLREKLQGVVP